MKMKIDLHVHSKIGSKCGCQSLDEIAAGALEQGLDAVCLTDHGNMLGKKAAGESSRRYGLPIFIGMEIGLVEKEIRGVDFLAFGPLEPNGYGAVSYEELRLMLDLRSVALIPAHPYRRGVPNEAMIEIIRRHPDDFAAIESYSINMTPQDSQMALALGKEVGLPPVANSDSHGNYGQKGVYYNIFLSRIGNVTQLVEALKKGEFEPVPQRIP